MSNDVMIDRLISQDKLIEYCEQHKSGSVPLEKIKSELPVIQKHGKWEVVRTGKGVWDYQFKCSVCHRRTPDKAYVVSPEYCPNCGAVMDIYKDDTIKTGSKGKCR